MRKTPAPTDPSALAFVEEILRTAVAWVNLVDDLIEMVEEKDPWPGENAAEVVIGMLAGSVRAGTAHLESRAIDEATALVRVAHEAILRDLKLAGEIAGRRERGHAAA